MGVEVKRFDVYLIALDPTKGNEVRKTRPCLIISPDVMNQRIATVIIAPMTSKGRSYPTRIDCVFQHVKGQVVLDQIRTVDKARLVRRLGRVSSPVQTKVLNILAELFAP